jgi:4-methylaminobutanoate oxidase (formaldehyde-forming)
VSLFAESEIVIIGGGAIGCGVAYSLAEAGKREILLFEREGDVGQVTTAPGAGLCGQVRSSVERVRLAMHPVDTFRERHTLDEAEDEIIEQVEEDGQPG